jgi:methylthioribose-1-phosphate isomerase
MAPAHSMATLEAIKYAPGSLELLDQRLLPTQTVFLPVPTTAVAYDHIKDMVRMPPAASRQADAHPGHSLSLTLTPSQRRRESPGALSSCGPPNTTNWDRRVCGC